MLTIYAPSNKPESKCWEVFNGIKKTWTTEIKTVDNTATETFNSPLDEYMFWGFTGNNLNLVHQLEDRKLNYWFTDTPYFGRFDNKNLKPNNHYWRIAKNNIHVGMIDDCPEDRLQKFNIKVKDRNKKGKHILVCPSSATVNQYIKQTNFLQQTMRELEKYTDRGVKISDIKLVSLLASPEGIKNLRKKQKGLHIFTCSLDKNLNKNKFIVPGLGDAGDRYMGT